MLDGTKERLPTFPLVLQVLVVGFQTAKVLAHGARHKHVSVGGSLQCAKHRRRLHFTAHRFAELREVGEKLDVGEIFGNVPASV